MKNLSLLVPILFWCALAQAADVSHDEPGSNRSGDEVVCQIKAGSVSVSEQLKKCKRGDILPTDMLSAEGMMRFCDFSKTVLYANGSAFACVYTGYVRRL